MVAKQPKSKARRPQPMPNPTNLGPEYSLPFQPFDPLGGPPYAADCSPLAALLPSHKSLHLVGLDVITGVAAPNGPADYWQIAFTLHRHGVGDVALASFDTSEDPPGLIQYITFDKFDTPDTGAGDSMIVVSLVADGSPGPLVLGCSLVVRDVLA